MLLIIHFYRHKSQFHPQTPIGNINQIPWLEFDHLYVWWFQFDLLPNKKGMASLKQYFCNLSSSLNLSCHWCLPIGLDSSLQSLSWDLSTPRKLFLFDLDIFPTKLLSLIRLSCLCREVLLLYPFFRILCSEIPCKCRFLKARIRKCLLTFFKERQSFELAKI